MDNVNNDPVLNPSEYTVGWITTLATEFGAARRMLDKLHKTPRVRGDRFQYATGTILGHNVVIACSGEAGVGPAGYCAGQMMRSFPNIKIAFLSGIGGGVPSQKNDIRLGDVVVSRPGQGHGGVAFYDAGKLTDGGFEPTGHLNRPPQELSSAVTYMESDQILGDETFSGYIEKALQYLHTSPTSFDDILYDAHDTTKEVIRQPRTSKIPQIHYGLIASGSWLIKTSGVKRDELVRRVRGDVLCFEMEAAGLLNIEFPCLVVRGISDYCDSHKNDIWHEYASMTAACYCKWALKTVHPITTQSSELTAGGHFDLAFHIRDAPQIDQTMSVRRGSEIHPLKERLCPERPQLQYSVPLETVPSYTVRQALSLEIEEKMRVVHKNSSVPHALAIHGLGGTGKTQLALKYVEDHKDKYNPILWISAQDEEAVRSSFERCASDLQLSVDRAQPQGSSVADSNVVRAVGRWLRERTGSDGEWLVVIDNADDVTWGIKKVIPKGIRGSIIITSQDSLSRKLISGDCEELSIDMMGPLEARALLLQHLNLGADSTPQDVCEDCDSIAEKLGRLALAVDLAGAYIANDPNQGSALKQYLTDYEKHRDELLQSDEFCGLSATDKTVWTVWDTTLEKIESRYADVRPGRLLVFLAHFSDKVIHDELFRLASLSISEVNQEFDLETGELFNWLNSLIKTDGQKWDSFYYRKAVGALNRYSLLQRADGEWPGASMHNLVQWRAKKYEESEQWDRLYLLFILAASFQLLQEVAASFELLQEAAAPQFQRYMLTHIPDIRPSALDDIGVNDEKKLWVWDIVSFIYNREGRWKKAEELQMHVIDIRRRIRGEEHPATLHTMDYLASIYNDQGRLKEAEELRVQVTEIMKRVLGKEHRNTLNSITDLTMIYRKQGRWKEAEELQMQATEISKRVMGEEDPDTLRGMNELAFTHKKQRRWKEAEELQAQVTETLKRVRGKEHPDTLTSTANLALIYSRRRRLKEAEELLIQVTEARKRVAGEEHPDTLTNIANLALIYRRQGRWKEAEELQRQVAETRKRVIGEEHPDTLSSIARLEKISKLAATDRK